METVGVCKVFLAGAIDEDGSLGMNVRELFGKLIEECGCEVLSAGILSNPIIPTDSPVSVCKDTMQRDLLEQSRCQATLVVVDSTPAVGTWIEMWEAYKQGQRVIVFVRDRKVRSVFLRGVADEIIRDDVNKLRASLKELRWIK